MKIARIKAFVLMMVISIMMFGSTLTVFADPVQGTNASVTSYLSDKEVSDVKRNIKECFDKYELEQNEIRSYSADYEYYVDKNNKYWVIKKDNIERCSTRIQNANNKNENVEDTADKINKIYDDLEVDTEGAGDALKGLEGPLGLFLGGAVILMSTFMTVFTAFDLSYIAFPVFREKCDSAKSSGNSGAMTKKGSNGETKLRFVTEDAQYAVSAANMAQDGNSPFMIYFKARILSFVLLAIMIFILLTGNIGVFTNIALRLVGGVLNMIDNM